MTSTVYFSVGNSSPLWTLSGVSSEGIAPTVGQYGSIYSLTRITTLISATINIVNFASPRPINCQVVVILQSVFASFAMALASLLIMLRVVAIWNRKKIILALAISVWGTDIAFLIHAIARLQFEWEPVKSTGICTIPNSDIIKLNAIVSFLTDIILLLMMLAGLLRLRIGGGGMLNLGNFLWKQGIIWISLSIVFGIPPVVSLTPSSLVPLLFAHDIAPQLFLILNLNEAFNLMFQVPAMTAVTISATRIYRSLTHFSSDAVKSSGFPNSSDLSFAKVKVGSDSSWVVPPSQTHVAVQNTPEHTPFSQKSDLRLQVSMGEQLPLGVRVKVQKLGPEEDVNVGMEKMISPV
ncbi:hypothetical protein BGW80DRAFT_1461593 [Lactifluus volemus]|nr:hypothetical protein BGW80DRAFT_1461593 [Lactifluus volemus]